METKMNPNNTESTETASLAATSEAARLAGEAHGHGIAGDGRAGPPLPRRGMALHAPPPGDGVRDNTDDSPHTHGRWTDVLKHRWPTALGVAVAALIAFDLEVDAGSVSSLSALTMLMPVAYLGTAALDRRRFAWVVLLAGVAVLTVVPSTSGVVPAVGFLVVALVFLVVGVARGQLRKPGGLTLQTVGMLAFGSIVLAALYVDPDLGGYLVAIALLGHAAWDAYHYLRNRVVARSYAECCAVIDLLAGAAILFVLFMR